MVKLLFVVSDRQRIRPVVHVRLPRRRTSATVYSQPLSQGPITNRPSRLKSAAKQSFAVLMQITERARAQSRRSIDASDCLALHDRSTMDHTAIPPAGSAPLSYARCAVYAYARTSRETEAEPIYSSIETQRDACYAHRHKPQSLGQPSVVPSSAPPPRRYADAGF